MTLQELLAKEVLEDKTSDLYKAMQWIKNTTSRGERKFTLPFWEFKSLTILHDQLVVLGYHAMILAGSETKVRKIVVWW